MTRRTALWALAIVLGATVSADIGQELKLPRIGQPGIEAVAGEILDESALGNPWDIPSSGGCLGGERFGDANAAALAESRGYRRGAAAQLADDPMWSDVVDCAQPHQIEVYATVQLPSYLEESITSYAALLDASTPLYRAIQSSVTHQCAQALPLVARAATRAPVDIDIVPMVRDESTGRRAWDPVPLERWETGERSFVCSFQTEEPTTSRYADIVTGEFPVEGRSCVMRQRFVPCTRRHDAERIALFLVDRAVANGHLEGADAVDKAGNVNLSSTEWTLLDAACQGYLNAIAPRPPRGLFGVADTYPGLYPNEYGSFNVMCLARSPFGTAARDMTVTSTSVYAE